MIVSPSHIIDGLILIIKANIANINQVVRTYDKNASLHLFKGIRKTLPLESFPSLEFEPVSGSMEWVTTSAQSGEYVIDCVLTVRCPADVELGVEYVSNLSRKIVQIFNYPPNMSWNIPGEWLDQNKETPVMCEYSDIRSVDYFSTSDYVMKVARWQMACRTVEPFPEPLSIIGPQRTSWKADETT